MASGYNGNGSVKPNGETTNNNDGEYSSPENKELRGPDRWIFDDAALSSTASIRFSPGINLEKERKNRREAGQFISDLGSSLKLTTLEIASATTYMHRFYVYHPFQLFDRLEMGVTCIVVAIKSQDGQRKIEEILYHSKRLLTKARLTPEHLKSWESEYMKQKIFEHESMLLQTLGFEILIDLPHVHIIQASGFLKLPNQISKTSYEMVKKSFISTRFCLRHRASFIACVSILGAANIANYKLPESWYKQIDNSISLRDLNCVVDWFNSACKPSRLSEYDQATTPSSSSANFSPGYHPPRRQ